MKFNIQHTAAGARHEIDLVAGTLHAARASGARHVLDHLNQVVQVDAGVPNASQQIYAMLGFGNRGLTVGAALEPEQQLRALGAIPAGNVLNAGPYVADDITVTGRLAVQAFLYDTIESALRENDYGIGRIFTQKAALNDSIAAERFERPILNYAGLAESKSRAIAQLSEPVALLKISTSQNSYAIPGTAIGVEFSEQSTRSTTLDLVALAVRRQAENEAAARIEGFLLSFLNGDKDIGMEPLSSVAGSTVTAKSLDPNITAAGELTHTAWIMYLFRKSRTVRIDTVITDIKGAMAIENRTGRPTWQGDDPKSPRINSLESILNPTWPTKVDVIISQDPNWPAGQIVGFDSRYAYHHVTSTVLAYQATEEYAIRRSTRMRFDSGSIAYRLYDEAWSVLSLTV